jgi:hypothetical protein
MAAEGATPRKVRILCKVTGANLVPNEIASMPFFHSADRSKRRGLPESPTAASGGGLCFPQPAKYWQKTALQDICHRVNGHRRERAALFQ